MAIGRAWVWERSGSVANAAVPPARNTLIAAQTVPAGYILAISDVQFMADTPVVGTFYILEDGVDITGYYCQEEKNALLPPLCYKRHYSVPIIIDASAVAKTIAVQSVVVASPFFTRVAIVGELSDLHNHTARSYGNIEMNGTANAQPILPAAYVVPTGRKLSITDLDFSALETAPVSPYLFEVRVNGVTAYYTELMHGGLKMISLEAPIEATAGQSVQLYVTDAASGRCHVLGSFTAQLL